MILSTHVQVNVRNRSEYWSEVMGRPVTYHDVIDVPIKLIPRNSNKTVDFRCDSCGCVGSRQVQLLNKSELHLCRKCSIADVAKKNKIVQGGVPRPWQLGEKHPRWRKDRDEYSEYKALVYSETRKFKSVYSGWDNSDKIGLCGVSGAYQLDHVIPIKYGFDNNISPSVIGNVKNLQIIPWEENRLKSDKHKE